MAHFLPSDFELHKYGLSCRLVNESDAEFILSLRLDSNKSTYISSTSNKIEDQIQWIREYKIREKKGLDFYFMYSYQGERAGVNRIYDIEDKHFIHGSWLFSNNVPPYCPLAAAIMAREIAFYILHLDAEIDTAGIHVDNTGVLQFATFMGEVFNGYRDSEQGRFLTGYLTKELFEQNLDKVKRLFPKKVI